MKGFIIALAGLLTLGGCAAKGPTSFRVPEGRYAEVFDIAKDEVQKLGFELVRIDARGGVITSGAVVTAGLATPWTRTEASFGEEFGSFLHRDQRRVSVHFTPEVVEEEAPVGNVDIRAFSGVLDCNVVAIREILHRPGLRLSPVAVRLSSVSPTGLTDDPDTDPIVRTVGEDKALSQKLARRIEKRLAEGESGE